MLCLRIAHTISAGRSFIDVATAIVVVVVVIVIAIGRYLALWASLLPGIGDLYKKKDLPRRGCPARVRFARNSILSMFFRFFFDLRVATMGQTDTDILDMICATAALVAIFLVVNEI